MNARKGDIYIADLTQTNMFFDGTRPVIIIKEEDGFGNLYIIPLTTQMKGEYRIELKNELLTENKFRVYIRYDLIIRINSRKLKKKVGMVDKGIWNEISNCISHFFDLQINKNNITEQSEIIINNEELFRQILKKEITPITDEIVRASSNKNKWKERIINGIIGFIFGILLMLLQSII